MVKSSTVMVAIIPVIVVTVDNRLICLAVAFHVQEFTVEEGVHPKPKP